MPNLTVQAADTATAMEEIWEKLGPDAMIVSTSKRNGRIVMEATTDNAKPAMAPSVKAGFSDIFTGHMITKPTGTPPNRYTSRRINNQNPRPFTPARCYRRRRRYRRPSP